MLIGYARVSTPEQSLEAQVNTLTEQGCVRCYHDMTSGRAIRRPGLSQALEVLRAGDTLVVWKLDRLGRTVKGLIGLVDDLERHQINLKSLTEGIDTSTPAGRFFFHMMASLAQMERELMVERTQAGLAAARAQGRIGGRKRKMTPSKVASARKLLLSGMAARKVAHDFGVSVQTLYRWIPAWTLTAQGADDTTTHVESVK